MIGQEISEGGEAEGEREGGRQTKEEKKVRVSWCMLVSWLLWERREHVVDV